MSSRTSSGGICFASEMCTVTMRSFPADTISAIVLPERYHAPGVENQAQLGPASSDN